MSVLKVTKAMFETELKTTDKVVMLDFYADWCGPCNMVAPLVAELAEENPDRFVCIDGNQTPQEIFEQIVSALKDKNCL